MPKLGTDYDKENYHKDYYQKNKEKECYKYKYKKKFKFVLVIDDKEYEFENKKDFLKLIKKVKIEE